MNENTEQSTQPGADKRLAVLKTEMRFDLPGLLDSLDAGTQVVLITTRRFGADISPDSLRRIGGVSALCNAYGATLILAHPDKLVEFSESESTSN